MTGEPDAKRDRYVDGLRGIAIVAVVIHHVTTHLRIYAGPLTHALSEQWGQQGVNLFFVVSGFCLSYGTLRARRSRDAGLDLATYAIKRLWRIMPPFVVAALALTALIGSARAHGFHVSPLFVVPRDFPDLVLQLALLDRFPHWVNPSFWSLALEFRWYLLFPAALALYVSSRRAFFTALAFLVVAHAATDLAESADIARLPLFMSGILAADIVLAGRPAWRWAVPAGIAAFVLALIQDAPDPMHAPDHAGWQMLCFCIVVAVGTNERLRSIVSLGPLASAGTISYSVYLVHEPLIAMSVTALGAYGRVPGAALFLGSIAFAAGALFYVCVERPLLHARVREIVERACVPRAAGVLSFCGIPRTLPFAFVQNGTAAVRPRRALRSVDSARTATSASPISVASPAQVGSLNARTSSGVR